MIPKTYFSAPLSKSAKDTERRIRNIFEGQRRSPAVVSLVLVAAVALLCGSVVAVNTKKNVPTTAEEAKRIAEPNPVRQTLTRHYDGNGWSVDMPENWGEYWTSGVDPDKVADDRIFRPAESGEWKGESFAVYTLPCSPDEELNDLEQRGFAVNRTVWSAEKDGSHVRLYDAPDGCCYQTIWQDPNGEYADTLRAIADSFTVVTPRALLLRALRGELAFPLDTSQTRSYELDHEVTLTELAADDGWTMANAAYTFVDLDGDGAEEAVYQRSDYRGFCVLRCHEGKVYGYEFNYRGLMSLKQDGTFAASAGAFDNGYGRLRFIGTELTVEYFMWQMENGSGGSCTIEGKTVSRDEYLREAGVQDAKPDVEWREIVPEDAESPDEINLLFTWTDIRAASEPAEQWTVPIDQRSVPKDRTGELLADQTLPTGERVVLFRSMEDADIKLWAVDRGEMWEVFCVEDALYPDGYSVSTYENVLEHDGFCICGPRGAGYSFRDYYYFDENGAVHYLAAGSNLVLEPDLNGDGTKEILYLYHYWAACEFLDDGVVHSCYLPDLLGDVRGWSWHGFDESKDAEAQVLEEQILPITLHRAKDQNVTRSAELRFSADGVVLWSGVD